MEAHDLIVIGGGPAGCTAAMYAARAGMDVLVLEKLSAGGQMALTDRIDNYPGFEAGIGGFELGEKMRLGAERFGAHMQIATVDGFRAEGAFKLVEAGADCFRGRAVIIATGASPKGLGLPGERAFAGRGIHYCAACDGMRYRGKTVAVIGGGNTAAMDALALSRICAQVIIVHRRDRLRAEKIHQDALERTRNVDFCWNSVATEWITKDGLEGVRIRNIQTNAESVLIVAAAFICVGRAPETEAFRGMVELDSQGYIVAGEDARTSAAGVFAAGDVRTKALRQIVTAASDGAVAARQAEEYLNDAK